MLFLLISENEFIHEIKRDGMTSLHGILFFCLSGHFPAEFFLLVESCLPVLTCDFLLVSSCLRELPALCIWALTRQLLGVIIQVSGSIHCQGSCHGDYLISSFLGCWGRSTDFLRHHLLMQIGLITSPLIILSHKDASIYHWITGVISWLAASAQHIAVHTQQVTTKVRQQLHILRQASCQVVNSVHKNSYTRTVWIP